MRHSIPADRFVEITQALPDVSGGLNASQVIERRARFGPNDVVREMRGGWRALMRDTARDPMIWFLIGTGLLYAFIGDRLEALVLIAAIVPLTGMDVYLHRRTRVSTQGLRGRLASSATVIREGTVTEIPALDLVPGDLVRVSTGQSFPADGLIVCTDALQVDESPLTGEAFPARKRPLTGMTRETDPAIDAIHWAFAGTRLLAGEALVRVVATGKETLYGEIVSSALTGARERTRLQKAIDRLVLILTVAAGFMCVLLGAVRLLQGYGFVDALLSAVTLAVAAIPEEFPVVFTFFLGVGVYRLAQRKALVQRAVAVENIGRVSCLCADKTGTLTEGRLHLAHCMPAEGVTEQTVLRMAALASRAENRDLLDRAVLQTAQPEPPGERVALFPFSEEARREAAVYRLDENMHRLLAVVKGAPETILARCTLDSSRAASWRARSNELAAAGHKVIACAWQDIDAAEFAGKEADEDYTFGGLLAFEDPIRDGAAEAVRRAGKAGIRLIMVTGDHPANALAVAREVGIGGAEPVVELGENLKSAIQENGEQYLSRLDVVARALPAQKLMLVRALQKAGDVVAVTGDGVNDVPALKAADVGIAMGESATQSAREAGVIVLLDDNLRTIVNAVAEGRQLFLNLRLSFAYLLIVHVPLVSSAALIPLFGFPLLYLPIHIVWLELIIHPTAMLGFQTPADSHPAMEIGSRQPHFFGIKDWAAIGAAGVLIALALIAEFRYALASSGIEYARAMALTVLIVAGAASAASLTRLRTRGARAILALTLGSAFLFAQVRPIAAILDLQPLQSGDFLLACTMGLFATAPALLLTRRAKSHEAMPNNK